MVLNYDSMSNESLTLFITSQLTMFVAVVSATVALNHLWRSPWNDTLKRISEGRENILTSAPPLLNGVLWLIDLESMALSVFFLINQWTDTPGFHKDGDKALLMGFLLTGVGAKIFYFVSISTFISLAPAMVFSVVTWIANVVTFSLSMYICNMDAPTNLQFNSAAPWFTLPQIIIGAYFTYLSIVMWSNSGEIADSTEPRVWDGIPSNAEKDLLNINSGATGQVYHQHASSNVVAPSTGNPYQAVQAPATLTQQPTQSHYRSKQFKL